MGRCVWGGGSTGCFCFVTSQGNRFNLRTINKTKHAYQNSCSLMSEKQIYVCVRVPTCARVCACAFLCNMEAEWRMF